MISVVNLLQIFPAVIYSQLNIFTVIDHVYYLLVFR